MERMAPQHRRTTFERCTANASCASLNIHTNGKSTTSSLRSERQCNSNTPTGKANPSYGTCHHTCLPTLSCGPCILVCSLPFLHSYPPSNERSRSRWCTDCNTNPRISKGPRNTCLCLRHGLCLWLPCFPSLRFFQGPQKYLFVLTAWLMLVASLFPKPKIFPPSSSSDSCGCIDSKTDGVLVAPEA